jgi:hypothetical protein
MRLRSTCVQLPTTTDVPYLHITQTTFVKGKQLSNTIIILVSMTDVMTKPFPKFQCSRKPGFKDISLCGISSIDPAIRGTTLLSITLCSPVRSTLVYNGTGHLVPYMTL